MKNQKTISRLSPSQRALPVEPLARRPLRLGLVVPHIFMQDLILPQVIFSPGTLALSLVAELKNLGLEVTFFSPGAVSVAAGVKNVTADLSYFEQELAGRGDNYLDLLKKHPLVFVSLARQVQSELIARAFAMANSDQLDVVHVYTNEEDVALPFVQFCKKPVFLTHHDPFSLLVRYKNTFPKYRHLNWLSISMAQRKSMPADTNWRANIYHGLDTKRFRPNFTPTGGYLLFMGRIIEAKGLHVAIAAVLEYNKTARTPLKLKIAGKHYAGAKDNYWQKIVPLLDGEIIEYIGFVDSDMWRQELVGNAAALVVPSIFEEPFGMVAIEALACATPVVALDSGALAEIVVHGKNGYIVAKSELEAKMVAGFVEAFGVLAAISRPVCYQHFKDNFSLQKMAEEHLKVYRAQI